MEKQLKCMLEMEWKSKALDALEKYELFVINSLGENKENLSETYLF